jgi:hypothetical protein
MPKIRPAPKADRRAFSKQLPKGQRPRFAALARLIDQHRTDLGWYHAVGKLVRELHDAIPAAQRGTGWATALAGALGVSPSLLQKGTRFVELYPTAKDFKPLTDLGLDWTLLYLTFAVKGRKMRQAFQRRAVREGWSPQEVRFRIQQKQGSRQKAGGQPRRLPAGYGPEVALREMARLSQRWQQFHAQIWEEEAIARQLRQLPQERYTEAMLRALQEAEAALAYLGRALGGRAGHGGRPAAAGGAGRGEGRNGPLS